MAVINILYMPLFVIGLLVVTTVVLYFIEGRRQW